MNLDGYSCLILMNYISNKVVTLIIWIGVVSDDK